MLIRLLRTYLRPYTRWLGAVVVLQLVGTMASLYLPSLNADIIDKGVAQRRHVVHPDAPAAGCWWSPCVQIVCSIAAVYFGARTAMSFGRDVRGAIFHRVGELLRARGRASSVRRR